MIPLFKVFMSDRAIDAVNDVLYSGYIGEGSKNIEFEKHIADVIDNKNVVTTNTGTSALTMALRMAGVGQGDYVISTPMTCIATNEPILSLGATPIWADVDKFTGNMTKETLIECIKDNINKVHSIKAIMCMHWGGNPCDVVGINEVGEVYNIPVIEDACQAFGSFYDEKMIGNHSDYTCFSFQAIKYVTSVDGGAIAFKNSDNVDRSKLMRWYGFDRTKSSSMRCLQNPKEYGYKFHMNDVNASIGIENLKYLNQLLSKVRSNAFKYCNDIDSKYVTLPDFNEGSTYWLFTLLVDDSDEFEKYMTDNGIACSKVHGRNDTKDIFISSKSNLPGVDYFYEHEICIPCGWWLSDYDVKHIVSVINKYKKG